MATQDRPPLRTQDEPDELRGLLRGLAPLERSDRVDDRIVRPIGNLPRPAAPVARPAEVGGIDEARVDRAGEHVLAAPAAHPRPGTSFSRSRS